MNITICICGGDSGGVKVTPSPKAPQLGRGWCSGPSRGGGGEARKKGGGAREATVERAALWGRLLLSERRPLRMG